MNVRRLLAIGVVGLGLVLLGPRVYSQYEGDEGGEGQGMSEEAAKMMEAYMKAGQPGPHHEHLDALTGHWNFTTRYRMAPEAEWEKSTGTAEFKWIMDGRYILEKIHGTMPEGEFEGMGIIGYDNIRNKHVSTWIDNMSTGVMISEGTCDASGRVVTYHGDETNPITKKTQRVKSVHRVINNDKHVFEMFKKDESGKEFVTLEVTYTRK